MVEEMWPRYGSFPFNPIVEPSLAHHNNVTGLLGAQSAPGNVGGLAESDFTQFQFE